MYKRIKLHYIYRLTLLVFCLLFGFKLAAEEYNETLLLKQKNEDAYALKYSDPELALKLNTAILSEAYALGNDTLLSDVFNARGVLYRILEEYDSASHYTFESLKIREAIGDKYQIAKSFNNLGNIYYLSNGLKNAKKYYLQSLEIRLEINDSTRLSSTYNNLGNVYSDLNLLDSSIYFYEQGLSYQSGNPYTLRQISINLGILYVEMASPEKAIYCLNEVSTSLEDPYNFALCYHNIGIAYEQLRKYDTAMYYINLANVCADSIEDNAIKRDLSQSYLILQMKQQNDTTSLQHLTNYTYYKDIIATEQINSNVREIDAKYQTEKKDNQLRLAEEKSKRMKAENDQNNVTIIALIAFLVILIVLVVILIRFFNQKRKLVKLELEAKKQEIERMINGYELDIFEAQNFGQQAERARIATDLHDRLGGLLAAVNLQIESLTKPKSANEQDQLDKIKNMISEGITEVRNVSHNMRSESLKKHGLKGALESICASIVASKKIKIDLYLDDLKDTNGSDQEKEIYKIVMELLSNALRHSKATLITLQISQFKKELTVVYEDNGIGFEQKKTSKGLGLSSIDNRVKKLKGNWEIDSQPGKGATIILNIPLS